jgi:hypothetical protein
MDDFVAKPVQIDALARALGSWLAQPRTTLRSDVEPRLTTADRPQTLERHTDTRTNAERGGEHVEVARQFGAG